VNLSDNFWKDRRINFFFLSRSTLHLIRRETTWLNTRLTLYYTYYILNQEITSVRLPSETVRRLDRLSKTIDRPKSQLIKTAIEEYLQEYEDYLISIGRLNDKNDTIISEKDLRRKLGL